MIKIISSHSGEGGSTEAFIQMTNAFNNAGYPCVFYGPHSFHLDKCRGVQLSWLKDTVVPDDLGRYFRQLSSFFRGKSAHVGWPLWRRICDLCEPEDVVIFHNIKGIPSRLPVKSVVLSCHEQHVFSVKSEKTEFYDVIHFVSEHQRRFHSISTEKSFVLPNFHAPLYESPKLTQKVGAVIGAIYPDKCTLDAIDWALNDGCASVFVFGSVVDTMYFDEIHARFRTAIDTGIIQFRGFVLDKQAMYDTFSDLYMCSRYECLPNVVAESMMTGKCIHIPEDRNYRTSTYLEDHNTLLRTWIRHLNL